MVYFVTAPLPVTTLNATATGTSIVNLSWAAANGSYQDSYHLRHRVSNGAINWTDDQRTYGYVQMVNGLFPGAQYTFTVKAVSKNQTSSEGITTAVMCKLPYCSGNVQLLLFKLLRYKSQTNDINVMPIYV